MKLSDITEVLGELKSAFPSIKRRGDEAPRVLEEWTKYLRPLDRDLVSEGISRWLFHSNHEPTMEQFLEHLDTLSSERRKVAARSPIMFEQVAPKTIDKVPVDEVKQLLEALYVQFDQRTVEIENERRSTSGPWRWGRRVYRDGMLGPLPGCDPTAPMMSPEEAAVSAIPQ